MTSTTPMRAAIAQIAPVLFDREASLTKVDAWVRQAADNGAALVAFGEALVPGYPVWLGRTGGAQFDSGDQKKLHALYTDQAVQIEAGHLDSLCRTAAECEIAISLGIIEQPPQRGLSLYCSSVYIDNKGAIGSVHRKLVPTYEERLSWAPGDGHGLVVHPLQGFQVGALNCWENWMPLARAAMYAAGETLHISHWPGSEHNTRLITPFAAREGRSYCLSASSILRPEDIPAATPLRDRIVTDESELIHNGGSCMAAPDGSFVIEPAIGSEELLIADLDPGMVLRERQNFDPSGHYSRPDVLQLQVDRRRQRAANFLDQ